MSLCSEAEFRAGLADAEFWEHVLLGGVQVEDDDYVDEPEPPYPDKLHPVHEWGRCPVCGEVAACSYDVNGDPLRHVASDRGDS